VEDTTSWVHYQGAKIIIQFVKRNGNKKANDFWEKYYNHYHTNSNPNSTPNSNSNPNSNPNSHINSHFNSNPNSNSNSNSDINPTTYMPYLSPQLPTNEWNYPNASPLHSSNPSDSTPTATTSTSTSTSPSTFASTPYESETSQHAIHDISTESGNGSGSDVKLNDPQSHPKLPTRPHPKADHNTRLQWLITKYTKAKYCGEYEHEVLIKFKGKTKRYFITLSPNSDVSLYTDPDKRIKCDVLSLKSAMIRPLMDPIAGNLENFELNRLTVVYTFYSQLPFDLFDLIVTFHRNGSMILSNRILTKSLV
jgi:hypothetical protein